MKRQRNNITSPAKKPRNRLAGHSPLRLLDLFDDLQRILVTSYLDPPMVASLSLTCKPLYNKYFDKAMWGPNFPAACFAHGYEALFDYSIKKLRCPYSIPRCLDLALKQTQLQTLGSISEFYKYSAYDNNAPSRYYRLVALYLEGISSNMELSQAFFSSDLWAKLCPNDEHETLSMFQSLLLINNKTVFELIDKFGGVNCPKFIDQVQKEYAILWKQRIAPEALRWLFRMLKRPSENENILLSLFKDEKVTTFRRTLSPEVFALVERLNFAPTPLLQSVWPRILSCGPDPYSSIDFIEKLDEVRYKFWSDDVSMKKFFYDLFVAVILKREGGEPAVFELLVTILEELECFDGPMSLMKDLSFGPPHEFVNRPKMFEIFYNYPSLRKKMIVVNKAGFMDTELFFKFQAAKALEKALSDGYEIALHSLEKYLVFYFGNSENSFMNYDPLPILDVLVNAGYKADPASLTQKLRTLFDKQSALFKKDPQFHLPCIAKVFKAPNPMAFLEAMDRIGLSSIFKLTRDGDLALFSQLFGGGRFLSDVDWTLPTSELEKIIHFIFEKGGLKWKTEYTNYAPKHYFRGLRYFHIAAAMAEKFS